MNLKFLIIGLFSLFLISCENGFNFSKSADEEFIENETLLVDSLDQEISEELIEVSARPKKETVVKPAVKETVVKPVVKETLKVYTLDEVDVVPSLVSCSKFKKDLKRLSCSTKTINDLVKSKFVLDSALVGEIKYGEVVFEFVVGTDGKVGQELVLSDFGHDSGKQVLEIFKTLKTENFEWDPAKFEGEFVKTKVFVTVVFKFRN
jgi:hypothetical protein